MRVLVRWRDGLAVGALISAVVGGGLLAYQGRQSRSAAFWRDYLSAASLAPPDASRPAARVVALSLAADEVLLDLVGPDRLAAVTTLAQEAAYSNVAAKAKAVGATVTGRSLERILHLAPDAVVVGPYTDLRAKRILRHAGIRVVELATARSFEEVREAVGRLAALVGVDEVDAAPRLLSEFDRSLERTRAKAARRALHRDGTRPRVLYLGGAGFESPWTAGTATLLDEILRAAGASNVAAEQGVEREATLTREAVLRWAPDILLIEGEPEERDERLAALRADEGLAGLAAVRAGQVILLPARLLTTTSHYVAQTADQLVEALEKLVERSAVKSP